METDPLVSIVIPVYNGSNYLAEAIDSALAQTYPNIEVIVVNDGSNDNHATREVAKRYDGQIRYYEKENGGVASALNSGIKKMKGDYFNWLSHDDLYDRNKIQEQLQFMHENSLNVSYCDYRIINQKGKVTKEINSPYYGRLEAMETLIGSGYIHGCTVMIQKDLLNRTGLFNEKLKYTQDVEMWFRILKLEDLKKLSKTLISSRLHQEQTSTLFNEDHKNETFGFYEMALEDPILRLHLLTKIVSDDENLGENETKVRLYRWLGDKLMRVEKNYSGAVYFFKRSIVASQSNSLKLKWKLIQARSSKIIFETIIGTMKHHLHKNKFIRKLYSNFRQNLYSSN